jgi:hypothetical protein
MPPKKGKKSRLPHIDRSRALPVRTGIGFWKVLTLGAVFGGIVYSCQSQPTTVEAPQTTQVVPR